MNIIKEYKEFADIQEDKIYSFSDYNPSKYNGNIIIDQIMEWLRAKLLDNPNSDNITLPIDQFFRECSVEKNKFMTFYNELSKTQRIKNFELNINNDTISFSNFKKNEDNSF